MMEPSRARQLADEFSMEAVEAVEEWSSDVYVLTFQENRRGGDPVAHTPDGKTVFPDKYRGGEDIRPGESWICDVAAKGGSTFFAAPLQRLDAAFFLDLTAEQLERIVGIALETHREALTPHIEAILDRKGDAATTERIHRLLAEKDALEGQLHELEEQYDDAANRLRRHELEVRTLRDELQRAKNGKEHPAAAQNESAEVTSAHPTHGPAGFAPVTPAFESGPVVVLRSEADVLESSAFTADRYYGHISPDRRRLFLKPHNNGNLPCVNGRVQIPGLSRLVPFADDLELAGHYDPRHGGFFIRL